MATQSGLRGFPGGASIVARGVFQTAIILSSAIISIVYASGMTLGGRFTALLAAVGAALRGISQAVQHAMESESPQQRDKTGLTILGLSGLVLALVIGGIFVLCVLPICIICLLALLGPVIGNVFSEINEDI